MKENGASTTKWAKDTWSFQMDPSILVILKITKRMVKAGLSLGISIM